VLLGLVCLLVLSAVTLWPNPARTDRVDRAMANSAWADRINFESDDGKRGDGA
jgi:hypothetical protein